MKRKNKTPKIVGKNIAKYRERMGWSQKELGVRIGVTDKAISNWEVGRTAPYAFFLVLLAKEFDIGIGLLLEGLDDKLTDKDRRNIVLQKINYRIHKIDKNLKEISKTIKETNE